MHELFHSEEAMTDLQVMREQSLAGTKPNTKFGRDPQAAVIHHHRFAEDCNPLLEHEFFAVPPVTNKELELAYWLRVARNLGGREL